VGLVGSSYLVDLADVRGLSIGPAVYGAVSGGHGGFFTLGGELAWRKRLVGPVGVEIGLYVGGGGGGGAPQGSGLMLRPHADLVWDLGPVALGASISHVRYAGGRIDSTQLGLVLNANSDFRFVPAERLGEPARAGGRGGLGFDRVQLVGSVYRTPQGKSLQDGTPLPRHIGMAGVRAEQSWGRNAFWGIEAARAGRDGIGGYTEYLGSLGVETELVRDRLTVGTRVGAGMAGGGGGVDWRGPARQGRALRHRPARQRPGPGGRGRLRARTERQLPRRAGRAGPRLGARRPGQHGPGGAADAHRLQRRGRALPGARPRPRRARRHRRAPEDRSLPDAEPLRDRAGARCCGWPGRRLRGGPRRRRLEPADHAAPAPRRGAARRRRRRRRRRRARRRSAARAYAGFQVTPSLALRAGAGRVRSTGGSLDSNVFDLSLNVTYGVSAGS
jgi:hypothetical protein